MIPQETVSRILDTAQILDVVEEFVTLRRRGQNYVGLCPFHNEKTPSFSVSPSRNICKCFSCGKGGTPIGFLMEHEQMTYPEALRWLARRYGIEIEERRMTQEEVEAQTAREGMLAANDFAQQTWESDLYESEEGRNVGLTYFRERGFQDETIRRFHLGYALESKTDLAERAMRAGHRRDYLLRTGLCYGDDPQRTPICRFRGRVIFPFHSLAGKTVAFGGRVLLRVDHTAMKYVNSPESEIYRKSNILYGIYEAKQEIAKRDKCYLVEGYTDVLSMSQAGLRNVVASSGTSLTTGQIQMIQRFTRNITVLYDGDAAGIRASLRGIDMLLVEGMNVKVLLLPQSEDPDSFCRKHTAQEVEEFIAQNETDFIRFKTSLLLKDAAHDPQLRAQMIQSILQSIALIPDPITASVYVRETSHAVDMPERDLTHALNLQRQQNYAAELRRLETEQRRAQAEMERETRRLAEVAEQRLDRGSDAAETSAPAPATSPTGDAATTPESETATPPADAATASAPIAQSDAEQGAPPADVDAPALAPTSVDSASSVSATPLGTAPAAPPRASLPTDRFERGVIRYIVRAGGKTFTLAWRDPQLGEQTEEWRVIDFIGNELMQEQIELRHPLYARMYQMALDATADPTVPFDSIRYFTNQQDPDIARTALDLLEDRYDALGVAQHEEHLEVLVPRCVLELKDAIVRLQIADLKASLRRPDADIVSVMQQITRLNEIRKALEKDLGERIVTIG